MSYSTAAVVVSVIAAFLASCSPNLESQDATIGLEDPDMAREYQQSLRETGVPFKVISSTKISVPSDRFNDAWSVLQTEFISGTDATSSGKVGCLTVEEGYAVRSPKKTNEKKDEC